MIGEDKSEGFMRHRWHAVRMQWHAEQMNCDIDGAH